MLPNPRSFDFKKTQEVLKPFSRANYPKANFLFFFTIIMLWSSIFLSYYALKEQAWLLAFSLPITIMFMCRSYVIEHDCGHLTFCKRPKWNDIAGNIIGFAIAIPYSMWKFVHNSHHKNVGNLSMRDFNPEVWTLTIAEYEEASLLKKTMYRFMRSRFNRLVLGPTLNIRQMLGVRVLAFAFAILFGHKLAQQTSFTYLL